MRQQLLEEIALLPNTAGHHLLLSLSALLMGIVLCLPVAILISRVKSIRQPALVLAGIVQTIPGLALLALMVPLLGRVGFLPAFLALLLYSMLPILHNTVTGILNVDRSVVEAARAIGMTSTQQLLKVELPLALPLIIAGIRTAAVWVVGTATLATAVGATSLGNHIFKGLQTQNSVAVLVGCVGAAVLAAVLDQFIRLLEQSAKVRSRKLGLTAATGLLILTGCALAPLLLSRTRTEALPVVVGAKTFTEQYILGELLTGTLNKAGVPAVNKSSMGSTILFDALVAGNVDVYVDYSGTLWANVMKRSDTPPRSELLVELTQWLKQTYGVVLLGSLGFENTYALAVSEETSSRLNINTLPELSRQAPAFSIGSDYEFFGRPEWRALQKSYDLRFAREQTFDPSLMYAAIKAGQVDVISAYSTDGRLLAYRLVTLEDTKKVLPPYDAVVLLSPRASKRTRVVASLSSLIGHIDNKAMQGANKLVDLDGKSVGESARELRESIEGHTPIVQ